MRAVSKLVSFWFDIIRCEGVFRVGDRIRAALVGGVDFWLDGNANDVNGGVGHDSLLAVSGGRVEEALQEVGTMQSSDMCLGVKEYAVCRDRCRRVYGEGEFVSEYFRGKLECIGDCLCGVRPDKTLLVFVWHQGLLVLLI